MWFLRSLIRAFRENGLVAMFLVGGFVGILLTSSLFSKLQFSEENVYVVPPKEMVHFSFGFEQAIAAIMWLRLLQDIDICTQGEKKSYSIGSSLDAVLGETLPKSRCHEGWVYHMLDRITDFSPQFLYAYSHGGLILSIIVDDREGARKIFEKGLKEFPDHYNLNFNAAYHYLLELQNPTRSAELMLQTYKLGGPPWLPLLASRLYVRGGMREAGITILSELIEDNPDSAFVEIAQSRLEGMIQDQ